MTKEKNATEANKATQAEGKSFSDVEKRLVQARLELEQLKAKDRTASHHGQQSNALRLARLKVFEESAKTAAGKNNEKIETTTPCAPHRDATKASEAKTSAPSDEAAQEKETKANEGNERKEQELGEKTPEEIAEERKQAELKKRKDSAHARYMRYFRSIRSTILSYTQAYQQHDISPHHAIVHSTCMHVYACYAKKSVLRYERTD